MLQHIIMKFSLDYLSSGRLREVKNKGKIQTFSSKSGRSLPFSRGSRVNGRG